MPEDARIRLESYLDENRQLKEPSLLGEFAEKAAEFGLKLAAHDNGIKNSYWQSIGQGTMWATANKVVCVNIYNPTSDTIVDSAQTGLQVAFGLQYATVSASRLVIEEVAKLNQKNFFSDPYTPVYAHSQGTAISNLAVRGIDKVTQSLLDLYNVGTASGTVPEFLHKYRSVVNNLDSTPMIVGMVAGLGGAGTSPGFLSASQAGRDYQVVTTTFDADNDHFNHSLSYYFSDPVARQGLGIGVTLSPTLMELIKYPLWV